jgi:hypothetical protein
MGYDLHDSGDHFVFVVRGATAVAASVRTPARVVCRRKAVDEKPNATATTAATHARDSTVVLTPMLEVTEISIQIHRKPERSLVMEHRYERLWAALISYSTKHRDPSFSPFFPPSPPLLTQSQRGGGWSRRLRP